MGCWLSVNTNMYHTISSDLPSKKNGRESL
jgi:hypothetical protein